VIIYKPTPKIAAMTFDLDDTLYHNWPYLVEAEKGLLNYISERYPDSSHLHKDDWQQFKHRALRDDPTLFSDMGELRRTVLNEGLKQGGYTGSALKNAVDDCFEWFYYQRSNFKVSDTVVAVLSALAKKLPLIAITNGNVNTKQIGIDDYFQTVLKASRNSPMKPHPHMFDEAAGLLARSREKILHVGDNLVKDVWGASIAGFSTAWHACDRKMDIRAEPVKILPNLEVHQLEELTHLV
jgi:putative hydrolase of the HAD superfamily